MAVDLRDYSEPGPLTSFEPEQLQLADDLPVDPVGICTVAQGLLIQPDEAVVRDPWDEWGRMDASYKGLTGPEYDTLMDRVAEACAGDAPATISRVYRSEDLAVPQRMIA